MNPRLDEQPMQNLQQYSKGTSTFLFMAAKDDILLQNPAFYRITALRNGVPPTLVFWEHALMTAENVPGWITIRFLFTFNSKSCTGFSLRLVPWFSATQIHFEPCKRRNCDLVWIFFLLSCSFVFFQFQLCNCGLQLDVRLFHLHSHCSSVSLVVL